MKKLTIGWKVPTINPALASLRYRALLPLLALEELGVKSKIITSTVGGRSRLVNLDALIIVKSFTMDDYYLAQEAIDLNVPVIFDLCDNIFIENYAADRKVIPADVFFLIASIADAITVSTDALSEIVRKQIRGHTPIYVLPDGIENKVVISLAQRRLFVPKINEAGRRLVEKSGIVKLIRRLGMLLNSGSINGIARYFIKSSIGLLSWERKKNDNISVGIPSSSLTSGAKTKKNDGKKKEQIEQLVRKVSNGSNQTKTILWFGNHGAGHAKFGMLDLLSIRESLEKIASELSVELIVVSNNLEKYKKHISPIKIPSNYYEWSIDSMERHFRSADVVIIPNSLDNFSVCKSANRSVLALSNGVPVVATSTPALEALRGCIMLDNFEDGLRRYLTDSELADLHVKRGQQQIERLYGQQAIGDLWKKLIDDVLGRDKTQKIPSSRNPDLIIAVHLPQDIALVRPIIEEAGIQGLNCSVWTSLAAIKRWPSLLIAVQDLGAYWRILSEDLRGVDANIFPSTVYAFLSATETNLNPHRFTHKLTKLANIKCLYTATLQHGLENVGLTYDDDVHDISRVQFASRHIYIWGRLDTLHPNILNKTRNKCIAVGCPKPSVVEPIDLPEWASGRKIIIGVFENLHWHRYSDEYRTFFLDGVSHIAEMYPNIIFLVKPHNAGMWLTSRHKSNKPEQSNVIVADPMLPQWVNVTADQLFAHLAAVITTPSTVALDASRVGLPVALVNHGLDLIKYNPLPMIQTTEDWNDFIRQVVNDQKKHLLQNKSHQFIDRVLLPSDNAVWRIVNDIKVNQITSKREKKYVE